MADPSTETKDSPLDELNNNDNEEGHPRQKQEKEDEDKEKTQASASLHRIELSELSIADESKREETTGSLSAWMDRQLRKTLREASNRTLLSDSTGTGGAIRTIPDDVRSKAGESSTITEYTESHLPVFVNRNENEEMAEMMLLSPPMNENDAKEDGNDSDVNSFKSDPSVLEPSSTLHANVTSHTHLRPGGSSEHLGLQSRKEEKSETMLGEENDQQHRGTEAELPSSLQRQQQENQAHDDTHDSFANDGIYVDPMRDINLAPMLHCCSCGCLPCCCCLYSNIHGSDNDSEEDSSSDGCPDDFPEEWEEQRQRRRQQAQDNDVNHEMSTSLLQSHHSCSSYSSIDHTQKRKKRRKLNPFWVNKNVLIMLLVSLIYGIAESLWSGAILAVYLFRVGGERNDFVGYLEATQATSTLLSTCVLGWFLDKKWSRSGLLKVGGLLFIMTALLNTGLLIWVGTDESEFRPNDDSGDGNAQSLGFSPSELHLGLALASSFNPTKTLRTFYYFIPLMALWGVTSAVINGPAKTLYSESIHAASRSEYSVVLFLTNLVGLVFGPLLSIIMFQALDNEWIVGVLQIILFVVMGLEVLVGLLCLTLRDRWALKDEENLEEVLIQNEERENDTEEAPEILLLFDQSIDNHSEECVDELSTQLPSRQSTSTCCIPFILSISSIIITTGGGMTVKFFPLYFKNDIDLSPSVVQTMYVIIPIAMCITGNIALRFSSGLDRVLTIVLTKSLGVFSLVLLGNSEQLLGNNAYLLATIFILRMALMNSTRPLEKNMLTESVEKERLAMWKNLDAVSAAAWAGGAALGGVLVDR